MRVTLAKHRRIHLFGLTQARWKRPARRRRAASAATAARQKRQRVFGDNYSSPLATIIIPRHEPGVNQRWGGLAQRRPTERSEGGRSGASPPHRQPHAPWTSTGAQASQPAVALLRLADSAR
jgi:hypothetical protein